MKKIAFNQLDAADARLIEAAREATRLSYSPYSHYSVGAAVLLENGEVIRGANQENASYPVGICAERATLATAQNLYPNIPVKAIALAASNEQAIFTREIVTPCGMCRQAMAECEKRYKNKIRILMSSAEEIVIAESVSDILPIAFL